jgi:hypothetical protein
VGASNLNSKRPAWDDSGGIFCFGRNSLILGYTNQMIGKNATVASQWTERINAAIQTIQREAEKSIREQVSTVESLLSRTQSEVEGIRSAIVEIESLGTYQPLSESFTTTEEIA